MSAMTIILTLSWFNPILLIFQCFMRMISYYYRIKWMWSHYQKPLNLWCHAAILTEALVILFMLIQSFLRMSRCKMCGKVIFVCIFFCRLETTRWESCRLNLLLYWFSITNTAITPHWYGKIVLVVMWASATKWWFKWASWKTSRCLLFLVCIVFVTTNISHSGSSYTSQHNYSIALCSVSAYRMY